MVSFDASAASFMTECVVHEFVGAAEELHARPMPTTGDHAELWVMRPTAPALVMGSSQKSDLFDLDRLHADGVELASRRSGGGAVFIDPAAIVWIDVLAPRSSELWSSDLSENFLIVGRVWQQALHSLGVATQLCAEAPKKSDAATLACWAGVGWGELTVGAAKIVGLSQRRTRWGARVQGMAVLDASSEQVGAYLRPKHRPALAGAISTMATGLTPAAVESAVLAAF